MPDRRENLEAELRLLTLQDEYDRAREAFDEKPTDARKEKYKDAKREFAGARREQRIAEGRPEGTGVGADN